MKSYLRTDVHSIERQIVNHVEYTVAKTRFNFTIFNAYQATAFSIRDRLIETLNDSTEYTDVSFSIVHKFSNLTVKLLIICRENSCKAGKCKETLQT